MPLPFPYPLCTARLGTGRQRVSQQRRLRTGADISPEAFRAWAPGPRPCWRKLVLGHRAWVIKCSQDPGTLLPRIVSVVLTIGRINDVFIPKHDGTEAPREA